jgi:hypothetical protein
MSIPSRRTAAISGFPGLSTSGLAAGCGLVLAAAVACGGGTSSERAAGDAANAIAPSDAEQDPACDALTGSVVVSTQAELNALEGCVSIEGSIYVEPLAGSLDLRPLAKLRRVGGQFLIGCNPTGLESSCGGFSDNAVSSLEGLNALEEAGRLQLARLGVRTLEPLGRLRRVGFLGVTACVELTSLAGLEQLERVDQLEINANPNLVSLNGLAPLPTLSSVVLEQNPALVDIGALAAATGLRSIALNGVAVEDLSALAGFDALDDFSVGSTRLRNFDGLGLRNVGRLYVLDNPRLEQVDALGALDSFGDITLMDNARLARLPEFAKVSEFYGFMVFFNPALVQGPSFPGLTQGIATSITFQGNDSLTSIDGFRTLEVGGLFSVVENPALRALDLSSLVEVSSLRILCNPQLPAEALAPLGAVKGEVTLPGDSEEACP